MKRYFGRAVAGLIGLAVGALTIQPVSGQAVTRIFGTLVGSTQTAQRIDVTSGGEIEVAVMSGGGGTSDTDDASIAVGQATSLSLALNQVYDGSVWRRLTIGTAGTASAQVLSVQGIASMTPLLATVTATNLDVQIGGSDTVQVQSNSANIATQTTLAAIAAQLPAALGAGGGLKAQIYTSAGVPVDPSADPCGGSTAKQTYPIDIVTITTTEITPSLSGASTYYYICSLVLITAAANNVALVDDNSDGCGSPTAGVMGGFASAAEGLNFAANSGLTLGNGTGTVGKAVTANSVLCIITSAAVQLSGSITVVPAP